MNKIVVRPQWNEDDQGGWYDYMNVGKNIAEYFYKQFERYGEILQFEAYLNSKSYKLEVYYIITYKDKEVVNYLLQRRNEVDFYIEFITFDLYADVEPYDSLGPESLHDDFPMYYSKFVF